LLCAFASLRRNVIACRYAASASDAVALVVTALPQRRSPDHAIFMRFSRLTTHALLKPSRDMDMKFAR
jgi:hypothetical protein